MKNQQKNIALLSIGILLSAGLFYMEAFRDTPIAAGAAYILVLSVAFLVSHQSVTLILASLSTMLILGAALVKYPVEALSGALPERVISILTLWLVTLLLIRRSKTVSQLRQKSLEMGVVFKANPDMLFRLTCDGTILGYELGRNTDLYDFPEGLRSKRMQEVLPAVVGRQMDSVIQEVARSRTMQTLEYPVTRPQGERWFETRVIPFGQNQLINMVRDITDRKRAELLLQQSNLDIKKQSMQLSEDIGQLRDQLEEDADVFQEREQQLLTEIENRKQQQTSLENELQQERNALTKANQENEKVKLELDKRSKTADAEKQNYEKKLAQSGQEKQEWVKAGQAAQQQWEAKEKELAAQLANAREEYRHVDDEKAETATALEQLKEEYAGSRCNWESTGKQHNEKIQALTHQQEKLKGQYQSQIETLAETLHKAETQRDENAGQVESLQQELAERASQWQSETGQWQEQVQSLTQRNQELLDDSESTIHKLTETLKETTGQRDRTADELDSLRKDMEDRARTWESQKQESDHQLQGMAEQRDALSRDMEKQAMRFEESLDQTGRQRDEANNELETLRLDYQDQFCQWQELQDSFNGQLEQKDREYHELENSLNEVSQSLDANRETWQIKQAELEVRVAQITEQCHQQQSEIDRYHNEQAAVGKSREGEPQKHRQELQAIAEQRDEFARELERTRRDFEDRSQEWDAERQRIAKEIARAVEKRDAMVESLERRQIEENEQSRRQTDELAETIISLRQEIMGLRLQTDRAGQGMDEPLEEFQPHEDREDLY